MKKISTSSLWHAQHSLQRPPVDENLTSDVCVVGAGIAGITTAHLLRAEGFRVTVLDSETIGGGQTCRTTAHLSDAIDDHYVEIERVHGAAGARAAAESHGAAISRIERLVEEESIDCDFARLDGYLFNPPESGSPNILEEERDAARRAGLEVELLKQTPLRSFDTGPSLRFPRQGRIEPMRYLDGLSRAVEMRGGKIFTNTRVIEITGGRQCTVKTASGHVVTAGSVVVATNSPVNNMFALHAKQAPYISYAITARVPRGSVSDLLLWDTLDPYHYVRIQPGRTEEPADALIIGGEDHKTGQANDGAERFARLEGWARNRFPEIETVERKWSGQVMETADGLGFIGHNPGDENVYVVSGDSGHGMTHGTIAGILLTDLIRGRENSWKELYDPSRLRVRSAGDLVVENANVAGQYLDWLTPGEVESAEGIVPGQGAIMRDGLSKIAVYRDEQGALHQRSAVCPHLGCIVAWNAAERSWDCPCHGSRFDCHGKVVNGPAARDLAEIA